MNHSRRPQPSQTKTSADLFSQSSPMAVRNAVLSWALLVKKLSPPQWGHLSLLPPLSMAFPSVTFFMRTIVTQGLEFIQAASGRSRTQPDGVLKRRVFRTPTLPVHQGIYLLETGRR